MRADYLVKFFDCVTPILDSGDSLYGPPVVVKDNRIKFLDKGLFFVVDLTKWQEKLPDFALDLFQIKNLLIFLREYAETEVHVATEHSFVRFEVGTACVTLRQANETQQYVDDSEILLRPTLLNTYATTFSKEKLQEFLTLHEHFGSTFYVSVHIHSERIQFDCQGITLYAPTGGSNFPDGWQFLTTVDHLRRLSSAIYKDIIISGGETSQDHVVFKDTSNIGLSIVLATLKLEPIL